MGSQAFDKFYQVLASKIPSKLTDKTYQKKKKLLKKFEMHFTLAFYKLISQNFDQKYVKNIHCN